MSEFSEIADQQKEDESDKAAGFGKGLSMPALLTGFFLSGFAALVYEIAWQRILVRITGATLPATTLILGIFLVGLMAGGLLAGFALKNSSPQRSLKLLIFAELLVAALAMASTVLTNSRFLEYVTGGLPVWLSLALLLLPPMILMGATLPLISGVLVSGSGSGSRLTWLYAGNTAGAFTGALLAGFVMLPYLGLSRTVLVTGTLNIVAACLFQYASRGRQDRAETNRQSTDFLSSLKKLGAPLAIAAFSSGLIFFFMEVIWTRFLVNILGSSTYAFAGVTAICILALAAGTVAAQTFLRRVGLLEILGLSSILLATSLYAMNSAPGIYLSLPAETFLQRLLANLVATSLVVLAPAIALGSIFPFCLREGNDETGSARSSTAALLFLNLCGCLAGVLLARAIFEVSARGVIVSATETGTMIMAALPVLVGLALFGRRRLGLVLVLITGIILFARPPLDLKMQGAGLASIDRSENAGLPTEQILKALSGENSEIVFYREGPASTISVKRAKNANLTLLIRNGKVEAQIPTDMTRPAPGSDLATHTLLGFLPYLYTKTQGSNALLIGYGSGTTCNTMSRLPGLASLTAVDIDPGVFETDSFFHSTDSSSSNQDVKPKKVVADARQHLLSSKKKYDIIVSQPSEPWVAGAGDLFSKEYFELLQSRLADQGVICQWLQLYGLDRESLTVLLATFHSAFPGACIYRPVNAGEIILVAVKGIEKGNIANLPSRDLGAELYRIGLQDTDDFLSSRVVLAGELGSLARNSTMLNTDNNLYCEYSLGSREHSSLMIDPMDSLPIEKLDRSPGRGSLALAQAWRLRQEGKWQSDISLCEAMPGMKPQARQEP
ncbi:MAG: fused MFS/spermidine synthase, partial [Cyanobacteria bacterium HKST-UBA02]|nr:fused MFS/spermidine synthase [Cyanobacteria bacterium HKST-UBA02]